MVKVGQVWLPLKPHWKRVGDNFKRVKWIARDVYAAELTTTMIQAVSTTLPPGNSLLEAVQLVGPPNHEVIATMPPRKRKRVAVEETANVTRRFELYPIELLHSTLTTKSSPCPPIYRQLGRRSKRKKTESEVLVRNQHILAWEKTYQ
jgi:hypothetical protein